MKSLRVHLYLILGLFIIGIIVGSFFDQQLSQGVFSRDNTFGLTISVIGKMPGYFVLCFIGGGFLSFALKKQYKLGWTILLYVGCIVLAGLTIVIQGMEFFGVNGFNKPSLHWVGCLAMLPFAGLSTYVGYRVVSKSEYKNKLLILLTIGVVAFFALVTGTTLIKEIFHRPRFRTLSLFDKISFHQWYQRCSNYKDLMKITGVISEEFKSFPSGHAGTSCYFLTFALLLPLLNEKTKKYQLVIFYAGLAWSLLVMFSRVLVGAHFLSDVSMGGLLSTVFTIGANEFLIRKINSQRMQQ